MSSAKGTLPAYTPQQLVPLLPQRLGAWQRESLESPRRGAKPGAALRAEYEQGTLSATLSLIDRRRAETASVHEAFQENTHEASVTRTLANGLTIVAISQSADAAALKALIEAIDLAAAEAMKRP